MKAMRSVPILAIVLTACFAALAFAQSGAGRYYNSNRETTARGTVEKVTNVTNGQGWYGVHLTLKSQDRSYDVRLGPSNFIPSNFIAESNFTFTLGDQIEVWGAQVGAQCDNILVARAVEKNGQTLTLRDPDGVPMWAGMGMRGGRGYGGGYGRRMGWGCRQGGCGCGCRGGW